MADARALLRAKRQEARIEHPLASYNAAGQLRCIACGIAIKQATAWEGHIGSKTHRTNAARLREERAREEQRLAEERERESLKRKAMDVDGAGDEEGEGEDEDGQGEAKRPRVESGHAGDDGEPRPTHNPPLLIVGPSRRLTLASRSRRRGWRARPLPRSEKKKAPVCCTTVLLSVLA
ncbi:hypothetical protein NUW54_g2722 [Trametes sanguinea]|uniref:Uncharacterized protein n=1 Tax=Trametes sanguinea TaxID=158606 RepID=A0ACC1Q436_9APHY|nr:hypothetical protein NUW54_g2722 [Trametes sanguinea]